MLVVQTAAVWIAKNLTWKAIGMFLLKTAITSAVAYGIGRLVARKSTGALTSGSPLDLRLDSLAPRRVIYGETGVGPVLRFRHTAGTNNKYLYLILVWAAHPCAGITALKADGAVVPLDGSGNATGTYAGVLRCTHHLGAHDQTADANFVSEIGGVWTSDHRLQGCTYSAIRVEWNQDKFPTGLPQFTAVVRGRMVYDERNEAHDPLDPDTWEWSDNPALCASDFLRGVPMLNGAGDLIRPFGIGAIESRLPSAKWIACANACDETAPKNALSRVGDVTSGVKHIGCSNVLGITIGMSVSGPGIPVGAVVVAVDGSGTFFTIDVDPTATDATTDLLIGETEKRYTCNGCFDTDASPPAVLDGLAGSMAGKIVPIGVEFYPFAGVWVEPDFTVDETMLRGLPAASNPLPRRERINIVKGTFNNPVANYQRDDFPQVVSDAFVTEDGAELTRDLDLAFTNSPSMSQRIAKIALLRSRQGIMTSWPCNLRAVPALTGENVLVDSTEFGWTGKNFELAEFTLKIERGDDGGLGFVPDLVMQETDSSIFDWSTSEEETKDPAPNTTLPDPRTVAAPTSLTLTSGATTVAIQADGTIVPRLKLAWTAPADQAVQSGGLILIEYKKSADSDWIQWSPVPGNQTFDFITDVVVGTDYDVRIRAENNFMVRSAYATVSAHTIVGDATILSAPTGLTATAGTGKAVSLDWDDVTDTRLGEYAVYRYTSNAPSSATKIAEVRASRFVDTEVTLGTAYFYWVTAITRSEVESSKSTGASATPGVIGSGSVDSTAPSDPAAATLNTSGAYLSGDGTVFSRLVINVPAMPSGAVILNVLYRRNGTTGWIIGDQRTAGGSTTSIDDLTPGVAYEVACQAFSVFGYGSNIVTATSSPFTAPNDTTAPGAPTSFTIYAGNDINKRPPALLIGGVLAKALTVTFAPPADKDILRYEATATSVDTDNAASLVADTNGSEFPIPGSAVEFYYWKLASTTGNLYLRVRAIDFSGNRGAWGRVGEINNSGYLQLPAGNMTEQNANAVSVTGGSVDVSTLKKSGTAVVTEARKINGLDLSADRTLSAADVSAVPTTRTVNGHALSSNVTVTRDDLGLWLASYVPSSLSGGAPSETVNIDVTAAGFASAPQVVLVQCVSDLSLLAKHDFSAGGNSATNLVVHVQTRDGSNIGAGLRRFSVAALKP